MTGVQTCALPISDGAGLLVLCHPWNPVGRVLEGAELDAVAALSARHGTVVFADEIHSSLILELYLLDKEKYIRLRETTLEAIENAMRRIK